MTSHTPPVLLSTRGLPASGKSTFARTWVAHDPDHRLRVNRDELRAMLFNAHGLLAPEQEAVITQIEQHTIRTGLAAGLSVIDDATNLESSAIDQLAAIAAHTGVPHQILDFIEDVEVCVARDRARGERGARMVGEDVIRILDAAFKSHAIGPHSA